jgi:hypothetical protein
MTREVIYTGKTLVRGGEMKWFLVLLMLLLVPLAARATCSQEDAPYKLKRTDRAYEQAMKLKGEFDRKGIGVTCVLPSKLVGMFEGQVGAAFYRTTVGVIDVMFLPESKDFEVRVVETIKDGRYLYSFEGQPHANTQVWDASHRCFFIQSHNYMFTTDDQGVAQRLRAVVAERPDSRQQTFESADGVFRFSYPHHYVLNTADNAGEIGVSMFPVCSDDAVCVVSRREYYAGTNLQAASFQEREIRDATTEVACLKGPPEDIPTYNLSEADRKRTIGGVVFTHGRSAEVGGGSGITSDFYRVFHRNKCYELNFSIAESSFANLDPSRVKEFTREDEGRVQSELIAILDSFRFL